jgi:L-fucose isomerase
MAKAQKLSSSKRGSTGSPVIGVFATCDPRIDEASRERAQNIVAMTADVIARAVKLPDGAAVKVVYPDVLVDGERQADTVAGQFKAAGVEVLVCAPDTWAFPQPSILSLLAHFPQDIALNITCGNSGPKPGVVLCHAAAGAISQYGKLVHINVGTWPDAGQNPQMTDSTAEALVDWCYAAVTRVGLRGRRVLIFGHDSMGMETALQHVIPIRNTFGVEITRLDMKLLADMLRRQAYDKSELAALRKWIDKHIGKRLQIRNRKDDQRFNQSLAMYLVVRDLQNELNAVGGGFMSQLEWGSDRRGEPLPVADVMESLFNSTFDHTGRKAVVPYATEADTQALLTQLFMTWLSGGNPPLFMDFRKVWEPWEIREKCKELQVSIPSGATWAEKGFVDGDNSGSASFDWAGAPGWKPEQCMKRIWLPLAVEYYFPGMGNSVFFVSPGGIEGIAGRLTYSSLSGMFSMFWDEASTAELPTKLSEAVYNASTNTWPHTYIVPKYATMAEYKQCAPANHFHMTWGLKPARLQYWMDLANVLNVAPWSSKPAFNEGVDRPCPLLYLQNGGETAAKIALRR